jgi:hypothetical protein
MQSFNQTGFLLGSASTGLPPMFSLLAFMLVGVVLASLVLLKLRQSLLVAYFLCGLAIANTGLLEAVAGPHAREAVASMSEIGVMLLLFVLGMEFFSASCGTCAATLLWEEQSKSLQRCWERGGQQGASSGSTGRSWR